MKHVFSLFTLLCSICIGGSFAGCSDDPTAPAIAESSAALELTSVKINTAELKLTTTNVSEYAFMQTDDLTAAAPEAAILFGTGTKVAASDGDNIISLKGLEGNKDYMIYVATKSGDRFGKVLSQKIHTEKYTDFLTIIEVKQQGITFHVEVPEGRTIGWRIVDRDKYLGLKDNFRKCDADWIGGPEGSVNKLTESTTVHFEGWVEYHETTEETITSMPQPSQALTLLVGEIEFVDKSPTHQVEEWVALFDKLGYLNDGGGRPMGAPEQQTRTTVSEDDYWQTEYHKTVLFECGPADKLDAKVKVDIVKTTTRSITMNFTPEPAIMAYGVAWLDIATWDYNVKRFGSEESMCVWVSLTQMSLETQPTQAIIDLAPGTTYRMLIFGKGNEAGTLLSKQTLDFKAKEASKVAPKVKVTGIKAPEGETETPYAVWFNVKCTSADAITAKYSCNESREWFKVITGGVTYVNMVSQFGAPLQPAEIAKLNSPEGLNLKFASKEDEESRLVVLAFNDEDTCNSPDEDKDGMATNRSIIAPALPRVDSPLFEELVGEWTATATMFTRSGSDWKDTNEKVVSKVIISEAPAYPEQCPEEAYAIYEAAGKTRAEVDEIYADFKKTAVRYAQKIHGKNRLTCQGLDFGTVVSEKYKSPVQLFYDPRHNAVTADDVFYDFGPKWYLEIQADGSVVVPSDTRLMDPVVCTNQDIRYYLVGSHAKAFMPNLDNFKVTISEDHNTLTVGPRSILFDGETERQTFYPSLASISSSGDASVDAMCKQIVLTKGWNDSKASVNAKRYTTLRTNALPAVGTKSFKFTEQHRKTRLFKILGDKDYKKVTIKQFFFNPDRFQDQVNQFN